MKLLSSKQQISEYIDSIIFSIGIIVATFVFFRVVHPIIVFDTDDWWYIYYSRKAWPLPGTWNPARIFPELLMPLVSEVASYTLYPLSGDFVGSLANMHAMVITGFVYAYIYNFYKLCKVCFRCSSKIAISSAALFYLFHFLAFRNQETGNIYLLNAHNVTCYFYYIIPALLNASLVMWIMRDGFLEDFFSENQIAKKSWFVLLAYLAIFSNLYPSIILSAYCASKLLINFNKPLKNKAAYLIIVIIWFSSCGFELFGGRAKTVYNNNMSLLSSVRKTGGLLFRNCLHLNRLFLIILVIGIIFGLLMLKNHFDCKYMFSLITACLGTIVFEILLCAVTGYDRIGRSDVMISFFFFIFCALGLSLAWAMSNYKKLVLLMPLVLIFVLSEINTEGTTFIESNTPNLDANIAEAITRDIVNQLISADEAGKEEIDLFVPKWETEDNWPHGYYAEDRFSKALEKHGVINRVIKVHMKPDLSINEKYLK